jgi:Holliday junction resolvase RusA-like endonuclease
MDEGVHTVQPSAAPRSISFVMPGPPVGKQRARVFTDSRTGKIRACTPKGTTQYEKSIGGYAYTACSPFFLGGPDVWPRDARYSLRVIARFGDNRRRDIDNVLKSVADGCEGILWLNDSQVHHMAVTRVFEGEPRTEVTVETLP